MNRETFIYTVERIVLGTLDDLVRAELDANGYGWGLDAGDLRFIHALQEHAERLYNRYEVESGL